MMKYIDTHAHYGHKRFGRPTKDVLREMWEYTQKIIQVGTNAKSIHQTIDLCQQYKDMYGIIGFFPTDVWEIEPTLSSTAANVWDNFQTNLANDKIIGIGEIGLDYNWNKVGEYCTGNLARKIQQKWFINQLDLAKQMKLPVSIHSRDAEVDTLDIFSKYESISGVIHCFSYGRSAARSALDKGLYLGIGGTSTYPNNQELREAIKYAPIDRLLLETDAPYLSPQQVRREVNTSAHIKYVVDNIAKLKNLSYEEVVAQTNKNAYELFRNMK